MGRFFNLKIRDMPNSVLRELQKSVRVTRNRIYGQTKGYLEEMRKEFNRPIEPEVTEEREKMTEADQREFEESDAERQQVLDRMAKARAARGKKDDG